MRCPLCDWEQHCPCKHCSNQDKVVWEWFYGEFIACGHCGLYLHCDDWEDIAVEQSQLTKQKGKE